MQTLFMNKQLIALEERVPPLVNILNHIGGLDELSQRKLAWYVGYPNPPFAFFTNGKTGECETLFEGSQLFSLRIVVEEARRISEKVGHTVYVFNGAHISRNDVEESMNLTIDHAIKSIELGADGVVFGFAHFLPSPDDILPFLSRLEDRMQELGFFFPCVTYNNPALKYGYNIPVEVQRQVAMTPFCMSIKDSSGDIKLTSEYAKACRRMEPPEFTTLIGDESAMSRAIELGIDGAVPSMGNIVPAFVNRYGGSGDLDKAQRQMDSYKRIFYINGEPRYAIHGLKTALSMIGIGTLDKDGNPFVSDKKLLYNPDKEAPDYTEEMARLEQQKRMMRNSLESTGRLIPLSGHE